MNAFTWLMMGHLIGDWVLQNDWMAKGKKQGWVTWAGMVHVTIYTLAVIVALWLSGATRARPSKYVLLAAPVWVSHWFIDATNCVERWMRLYRQSELEVVRVMVDQTFHLLILVFLALIQTSE